MDPKSKQAIIDIYRRDFQKYGDAPEASGWSTESQLFRFEKLAQIADLGGKSVLEVGCGPGAFYPYLKKKYGSLDFTGVDIVPELIECAAKKYPDATFFCQDILEKPLTKKFDYVLISGTFNNEMAEPEKFMQAILLNVFALCEKGVAFNFISTYVNSRAPKLSYFDPAEVTRFCIEKLTPQLSLHHHYERCDVAVYLRK